MKRLTDRTANGIAYVKSETGVEGVGVSTTQQRLPELISRLAAYEDTGLEPEEVYGLCEMDKRSRMAKMLRWEEAERNGRLVVLPCKVGDLVYALWDVPTDYRYVIYCAEAKEIRIAVRNCRLTTSYLMEPIEYRGRRKEYRGDDFGKTVFLTLEEAEAALKEMEEENA